MSYTRKQWRLIISPPARGPWNMAVDEAIMEAAGQGKALPTLRLYAWEPACLSLGFAQPASEVDVQRLQKNGWDLVRRPTGGRAILHTDELTYAVIGSQNEARLSGSVIESYRRLSQALLKALQLLGLPAETHPEAALPVEGADGAVCFETPSNYEIVARGKKLVGSAQARRREAVLQHGSLPLTGDLARITLALVFPDETARQAAAQRVKARAATVEDVLGKPISWEAAAQAFQAAFKQVLNLELVQKELSQAELARAEELLAEKYDNPEWTRRV